MAIAPLMVAHSPQTYVVGSWEREGSAESFSEDSELFETYPFRRLEQRHQGLGGVPTACPADHRVIARTHDGCLPRATVDGAAERVEVEVRFVLRQEKVHEPAHVEQGPFDAGRLGGVSK